MQALPPKLQQVSSASLEALPVESFRLLQWCSEFAPCVLRLPTQSHVPACYPKGAVCGRIVQCVCHMLAAWLHDTT